MSNKMQELVIEAGASEKNYWKDIWNFRELFYILSWRDIKVRYKQTSIGAAWALLRPLLTMIVFVFIFGRVAGLSSQNGPPYAIIVFAGLLPWQFFANALSEASNSLIGNTNLISKVYFPRMIIPAASVITSLVDFAISFAILVILMIIYRFVPPIQILFLPAFIILAFIVAFGIGLYITALNVKYRDFRYIIPFVIQYGIYISPVGFNTAKIVEKVGSKWQTWLYVNPLVGIIDGFRWCIVGEPMYWPGFFISVVVISFFLWLGIWYFRKTERSFADNI
jgi:lipopolysaccharide transport system permease protein